MSYVKIDSLDAEAKAIADYANLTKYIQAKNREEKLHDFNVHVEASKLFKPIIESTRGIQEGIKDLQQHTPVQHQQQQQ